LRPHPVPIEIRDVKKIGPARRDNAATVTPGAPPSGMPETPRLLLVLSMALVIGPVVYAAELAAHLRTDVVDDQLFGYFGWRIVNGARLYLDVWDNKPPGIYWLNALGFWIGRGDYLGVVALCAVAVCLSLVAFYVVSASVYYRGAAALTTVLASFYLTHGFYQGGANLTETYVVCFELAAVALYMRGCARDRWWVWLLSGALCGCAVLCKQVGLAAWGAMGVHALATAALRDVSWRAALRRCAGLAGGVALVVGLAATILAMHGILEAAWHAVVEFNRGYFEAGKSSFAHTFVNRYFLQQQMMPVLQLPLLMTAAAVVHAVLWALRPRLRPAEVEQPLRRLGPTCPRPMLLFGVWFLAAFYGAIIAPHYFEHYLVPLLPPLLLMAGYLVNVLRTEIGLLRRFQQRIWVTATFVLMAYLGAGAVDRQIAVLGEVWLYRLGAGRPRPPEWEMVAAAVTRHSLPSDRVQCFGYFPGVYLHSRRINHTRYATTEKVGQISGTAEAEVIRRHLIRELTEDPPAIVVIEADKFFMGRSPWLARVPVDPLDEWAAKFVMQRYAVVADELNVFIFKRRDLLRPGEPTIALPPEPDLPGAS
jgi:hypothetical protein